MQAVLISFGGHILQESAPVCITKCWVWSRIQSILAPSYLQRSSLFILDVSWLDLSELMLWLFGNNTERDLAWPVRPDCSQRAQPGHDRLAWESAVDVQLCAVDEHRSLIAAPSRSV